MYNKQTAELRTAMQLNCYACRKTGSTAAQRLCHGGRYIYPVIREEAYNTPTPQGNLQQYLPP